MLLMSIPCFAMVIVGALLVRNWIWLLCWEIYAAILTSVIGSALEGVHDGLGSGPVIAFVIAPMILGIIVSIIPGALRIESKGDEPLSPQVLTVPIAYAVVFGIIVFWFTNQI